MSNDIIGISARSKEKINVGKLMAEYQNEKNTGGGNPYSAAAQIVGEPIEEISKKLELRLRPDYYIKEEEK